MSSKPGFTLLKNLSESTDGRAALKNLLSSEITKDFDVDTDLSVFKGNLQTTDTYTHVPPNYKFFVKYDLEKEVSDSNSTISPEFIRYFIPNGIFVKTLTPVSFNAAGTALTNTFNLIIEPGDKIKIGEIGTDGAAVTSPFDATEYTVTSVFDARIFNFNLDFVLFLDKNTPPFVGTFPATADNIANHGYSNETNISVQKGGSGAGINTSTHTISNSFSTPSLTTGDVVTEISFKDTSSTGSPIIAIKKSAATGGEDESTLTDSQRNKFRPQDFPLIVSDLSYVAGENKSFKLKSIETGAVYELTHFPNDEVIEFKRLQGVTPQNFKNIAEPEAKYASTDTATTSVPYIGFDENNSVTAYSGVLQKAENAISNAAFELERGIDTALGSIITVPLRTFGTIRLQDPANLITTGSTLVNDNNGQPGVFIVEGTGTNGVPQLNRAFSNFEGVWSTDTANDVIRLDNDIANNGSKGDAGFADISFVEIGNLVFEDNLRLEVNASELIEITNEDCPTELLDANKITLGGTTDLTDQGFTDKIEVIVEEFDQADVREFKLNGTVNSKVFSGDIFKLQTSDSPNDFVEWSDSDSPSTLFRHDGTQWILIDGFKDDGTTVRAKRTATLAQAPYPWSVDNWTNASGTELASFAEFYDFKDGATPAQALPTFEETYFVLARRIEE